MAPGNLLAHTLDAETRHERVASIRILPEEDRIEITLQPGFTRTELDVVRALPGRRYDVGIPHRPVAISR